jgi:NitT/TauT family transport system ATP-binding protein
MTTSFTETTPGTQGNTTQSEINLADKPGRVHVAGVEHVYGHGEQQVVALLKTDLTIEAGEIVTLVGPSGSGKTTLLNIVAGLIKPSAGTVTIVDQPGARRRNAPTIGYMTQHDTLLPWRRTLSNIALPLEIQGVVKAERLQRSQHLLEAVGLTDFGRHYPHQLSGGMRQRVSLARALVHNPGVLLLDEPFGALDSGTRAALHEVLLKIHAELKTTVLLVTHDLGESVALSDRILALGARPGRIKQEFTAPARERPDAVRDIYSSPELIALHNEVRAAL